LRKLNKQETLVKSTLIRELGEDTRNATLIRTIGPG